MESWRWSPSPCAWRWRSCSIASAHGAARRAARLARRHALSWAINYALSEGASRLLSSELGSVAGLLAAALVVFLLAPLQRFANRVASAAMPNTQNTPEYAAHRKLQVYESAIAEALQGGDISGKERALLNRLRDTLGIAKADANALEHDLRQTTVATA